MSRTMIIAKGYSKQIRANFNRYINVEGYSHMLNNDIRTSRVQEIFEKVLSPEIDIFSDIPQNIYDNENAKSFLGVMRKYLLNLDNNELGGITFPKLRVTEFTEVTIVIEWIFNYFRLYFSFDKNEGDFYGEVINDIENGRFHNEFKKMQPGDYSHVIEVEVSKAVMMAGGL